jgi:UDP-N-acetylmuramyl pentapeptide phosphotransferase/UDP-N-acetylglucosamine-1-phosphate transferase
MLRDAVGAAAVGLIGSVILVALVRSWARLRLLDHPNERSLHVQPMPRGAGIGIVVPVCMAIGAVALRVPDAASPAMWLVGCGLLIAMIGLSDDVRGLSAVIRLVAHLLAAGLIVSGMGAWQSVVWPGVCRIDLGWAAVPLTMLLVAGFTNAYNFMDGVDGIAGSQAVVAGVGWLGLGYVAQDPLLAGAGAVIAAASLGFLFFNWPPASIFMGDVGSSFLGFSLAALAVYAATRSPAVGTAGMLFVWPFVFDATFTFFRRVNRREDLLAAHRSHLYQRLVLTGVSHRTVSLLYGTLALVGVGVGQVVARERAGLSLAGAVLIGALGCGLWVLVVWRESAVRRLSR